MGSRLETTRSKKFLNLLIFGSEKLIFEGQFAQKTSKSYPWDQYAPKLQELVAATYIYNEDPGCAERRKADWVWEVAKNARVKGGQGEYIYSRFEIYLKKPDAIKAYFGEPGLVILFIFGFLFF